MKNKIIILIAVVCIISLIVGGMNNLNKASKHNVTIKTDKTAIINRFPKLGDFQKCYWKADVIGKEGNDRVPGPSAYWMKGFVEIDKEKINTFIEKYHMEEISLAPQLDFMPENYDIKRARWFYSDEFNEYIKPPSFFGKFYIDSINQIIYFDVRK